MPRPRLPSRTRPLILATFNIFWFGTADHALVTRSAADDDAVRAVLAWIGADVLVLQEIVDLERLEQALPPGFRIREGGHWLCPTSPDDVRFAGLQKIVIAVGPGVEVLHSAPLLPWPGPRPPLVLQLRRGPLELTVVGLHLKSGDIDGGPGEGSARIRSLEAAALGAWLHGRQSVVVAGDLNARARAPSLAGLLPAGWCWPKVLAPPDSEAWTTWIDRAIIDQILTSPDLVLDPPEVLAFDLDPQFAHHQFRTSTGFQAARLAVIPFGPVENLYRVSDHRPLRARLRGR